MEKTTLLVLILALVPLEGCSSRFKDIPLPRNVWEEAQNRRFENLTVSEFLNAAEKVILLSDDRNINKGRARNHYWITTEIVSYLAGLKTIDRWDFTLNERDGGLDARVHVSSKTLESHYLTGKWQPYRKDYFKPQIGSMAAYKLFWARVNYILGRSKVWQTCSEAERAYKNEVNRNIAWLRILCVPVSDDTDPRTQRK